MNAQTKARIMLDLVFCRDSMRIDESGNAWRRDPWQEEFLAAMDGGWQRAIGRQCDTGFSRGWSVRPRGHSKTTDAGAAIAWALYSAPPGFRGVVAAADQEQARFDANAVSRHCQRNAFFRECIEVQRDKIVNTRTGSEFQILASDAPTSMGLLVDAVLCDEISAWKSRDLWDSLFSAAAKKANCLLLVLGNAGWHNTWQHELWESVQGDPRWFCHSLPGPVASWLDQDNLAEQRRLLHPLVYDRLWNNVWTSGEGSAFDPEAVDRAITRKGPERRPRDGWRYFMGADLSVSRDWTACCIVGKRVGATRIIEKPRKDRPVLSRAFQAMAELGLEGAPSRPEFDEVVQRIRGDGKVRLVDLKLWKPRPGVKVDLREVERYILEKHEQFGIESVNIDQYQAELLSQRLMNAGVDVQTVAFTASACCDMAATALAAFNDGRVQLHRNEQLIDDLKRCTVKETNVGARIEIKRKSGRGHGDALVSFLLALLAARDAVAPLGDELVDDSTPLIWQ